jgi:F-type H+-transporting ATPase subunit b
MLIDWFTVVAQAVNFLILVWLLKRLLFQPVLAAIDAREKRIATQLAQATQTEAQARTEREEFQRRNEMLAQEREAILRKASDAAETERQRLLEAARQDAQSLRARLTDVLTKERQELGRQLAARTQAEVFELTRKALTDLAGVGIEGRMIEVFMDKVRALPEFRRTLVSTPASDPGSNRSSSSAVVRSAFDIKPAQRAAIEHVVLQYLGPEIALRFERSPQLVCGIELTLEGVKLAWSVTDYVTRAAQDLLNLTPGAAASAPEPEARHG